MTSLILTVISIVLLSAVVVVSINYLPAWPKEQAEVAPIIRDGLRKLDRAYTLYAQAHADAPAGVVGGDPDGGVSGNFTPFLGFVPAAPVGYRWHYGQTDSGAPPGYQNTHYFCLAPQAAGAQASKGKVMGALKAQQSFSDEQMFVSPNCGVAANAAYVDFPAPMAVTLFVKYIRGQV
jgi:hypothetical protein